MTDDDQQDDAPRAEFARVQEAARELSAALDAMPHTPRVLLPALQLPRLFAPAIPDVPEEPDKRHLVVAVRTVPVLGMPSRTDVYRDPNGLTWQTYGAEHDFSQDRLLEIQNADEQVVATYPPGTWLLVRYEQYADGTEQVAP